jgi:hypothetical protein
MSTTVVLERTRIEVGTGRPGYRWTTGYYVIGPNGVKQYPPLRRREAYAAARQQWPDCKVTIKEAQHG